MPQPAVRLSVGLTVSHAGTGISDRFGSRMRTMGNDPRRAGGDSVAIRNFSDFLRLSGRAGHSVGSGGRLQSDVPCSESISEIWMLRR